MKKIFSKIAMLSVGLAMAIGVGIALGRNSFEKANAAYVLFNEADLTAKTAGTNTYGGTLVYGDWTIHRGSNNNKNWAYFKIGGKNITDTDCYIKTNTASTKVCTKATVNIIAGSLSKTDMVINSWGLYVYSDAELTNQTDFVSGGTITKNAALFTFEPSAGKTWAVGSYFKVNWNITNGNESTSANGVVWVDNVSLYETKNVSLESITLSSNSVSGCLAGSTFGMDQVKAAGITVTANYDDDSHVDVTASATVESPVTLVSGANVVVVSYGGKTANLTVNAKTQDELDTDAANAYGDLVDGITTVSIGSIYNNLNDVHNAYNALNANAKSKAADKYAEFGTKAGSGQFVIFTNELVGDSSTALSTTPATWYVPSNIELGDFSAAYNGKVSSLKLGTGSLSGSFSVTLNENGKHFKSVTLGVAPWYNTANPPVADSNHILVSAFDDEVDPSVGEVTVDISAKNLTAFTIGTDTKRAYINYIYYEIEGNGLVLDTTLTSEGACKTAYQEGQSFKPAGLTISATYNSGTNKTDVTDKVEWPDTALVAGQTKVTGTYTENEVTATIDVAITVSEYQSKTFGKVGKALSDYSGTYFLSAVTYDYDYAPTAKIWKAIGGDLTNSYFETTYTSYGVSSSKTNDSAIVEISKTAGGYSIKNIEKDFYIGIGKVTNNAYGPIESATPVDFSITLNEFGVATITTVLSETTYYARFNSSEGQNRVRFYTANTTGVGLTLMKADASAVKADGDYVYEFVNGYMHMGDIKTTNVDDTNACRDTGEGAKGYYSAAATAFNALSEDQRDLFASSSVFANPKARLLAWADANGQKLDNGNSLVNKAPNVIALESNSASMIVVIIAAVSLSAAAFGAIFLSRRRKED